jgi:threonine dehydrogenase-like Zn-dependent dehydrogenase
MSLCKRIFPPWDREILCKNSASKKVYKIFNLTDEEATLVEPAACAVHGADKLNLPVGAEVLILGAGPTGTFRMHLIFPVIN